MLPVNVFNFSLNPVSPIYNASFSVTFTFPPSFHARNLFPFSRVLVHPDFHVSVTFTYAKILETLSNFRLAEFPSSSAYDLFRFESETLEYQRSRSGG